MTEIEIEVPPNEDKDLELLEEGSGEGIERNVTIEPDKEPSPSSVSRKKKSSMMKSHTNPMAKKLMGENYNKNEVTFAGFALVVIALNTGFMNATCMSGHLFDGGSENTVGPYHGNTQMVAGFAGSITSSALDLTQASWDGLRYNSFLILSYMFGAVISGIMSPFATPYVILPYYGPSLFIGFLCLLIASQLSMWQDGDGRIQDEYAAYIFYLVVCANGIQQAVASIYSANLIRCTITGAITDIGIVIGQALRGQYKSLERGIVLSTMIFFFWVGSLLGHFTAPRLKGNTLVISAAIFFICAASFPIFLCLQLGINLHKAVFGTWKLKNVKKAMKSIENVNGTEITKQEFMDLFDDLDFDHTGDIDHDKLIDGLMKLCVKLTPHEFKMIFELADKDGDGKIDRDEWNHTVSILFK